MCAIRCWPFTARWTWTNHQGNITDVLKRNLGNRVVTSSHVCVCFVSRFFLPNCLFDPRLRHSAFKAFCSLFASAISIASAIIFHSDLTCLTKDHRRAGGVSANCFPPLLLRSREASVKKKKTNKITNIKKSFVWNGAEWRSWNLEHWIWFCRSCLLVMMVIVIVLAALVERESRQDGNERHG